MGRWNSLKFLSLAGSLVKLVVTKCAIHMFEMMFLVGMVSETRSKVYYEYAWSVSPEQFVSVMILACCVFLGVGNLELMCRFQIGNIPSFIFYMYFFIVHEAFEYMVILRERERFRMMSANSVIIWYC